jgi:uncharacterized membrane protein YfcA
MEYLLICLVALGASLLTFFSGFGLNTLLLPVFALFFPLEAAVAMTAIVHLLNNVFKTGIIGKHIHWRTALLFGITGIVGAIPGALALGYLGQIDLGKDIQISGMQLFVEPLCLTIGTLLIVFALLDFFPDLIRFTNNRPTLLAGGFISGFFGGLSGHQGALRSAFLIKLGLGKEAFIATGVIIAVFIDVGRLGVYFSSDALLVDQTNYLILIVTTLSAFLGAYLGRKFLKKLTLKTLRYLVGALLIVMGVMIAFGIV